ncbi:TetR/AcrR family transcriptional regulator [Streptomyces oceani]|uniref:TetR family transcriptional regulator n=1 Tax=Streptomyces oceani TaxID=1075402 RepID=A0A1E7KP71_9ACTN|nr:TetR/AcrR family transcriptional regulator [Streptomyces oceani]OEV05707.1 TetR family transcriptional regulator [Streptomyces oceani]
MVGLRERKKQQTRLQISDIATGLFLERGFDAVTIAEIAEAAEVSVNTVYNYFPAKEDLFFDRESELMRRPSDIVREREPGQSAAEALLEQLRSDLDAHSWEVGMHEGFDRFVRCIRESPALLARLYGMERRIAEHLAEVLREEVAADADDPTPEAVATQLVGMNNAIHQVIWNGVYIGHTRAEVGRRARRDLDVHASLLSDTVLNYATRPEI